MNNNIMMMNIEIHDKRNNSILDITKSPMTPTSEPCLSSFSFERDHSQRRNSLPPSFVVEERKRPADRVFTTEEIGQLLFEDDCDENGDYMKNQGSPDIVNTKIIGNISEEYLEERSRVVGFMKNGRREQPRVKGRFARFEPNATVLPSTIGNISVKSSQRSSKGLEPRKKNIEVVASMTMPKKRTVTSCSKLVNYAQKRQKSMSSINTHFSTVEKQNSTVSSDSNVESNAGEVVVGDTNRQNTKDNDFEVTCLPNNNVRGKEGATLFEYPEEVSQWSEALRQTLNKIVRNKVLIPTRIESLALMCINDCKPRGKHSDFYCDNREEFVASLCLKIAFHAVQYFHLKPVVRVTRSEVASGLAGREERGVFAIERIPKGNWVCAYVGRPGYYSEEGLYDLESLCGPVYDNTGKSFFIRGNDLYRENLVFFCKTLVDAFSHPCRTVNIEVVRSILSGSLCNHGNANTTANAQFCTTDVHWLPHMIEATRDIEIGEEIFVSYGNNNRLLNLMGDWVNVVGFDSVNQWHKQGWRVVYLSGSYTMNEQGVVRVIGNRNHFQSTLKKLSGAKVLDNVNNSSLLLVKGTDGNVLHSVVECELPALAVNLQLDCNGLEPFIAPNEAIFRSDVQNTCLYIWN